MQTNSWYLALVFRFQWLHLEVELTVLFKLTYDLYYQVLYSSKIIAIAF